MLKAFTCSSHNTQVIPITKVLKPEQISLLSLNWDIQSTLVISKSMGPSERLRDIRTSTYQICRIEENTNRTTEFQK